MVIHPLDKNKTGKEAREYEAGGVTILYRAVRKSFTGKGPFIQRPTGSGRKKPCRYLERKNVLGRGESQCRGPEALAYLLCLKNEEAGFDGGQ